MLHLLQYCQNDFTFSPSLYSVALCDNIGLVLLILRLAMLFCHSSYCTMCIIHPDLVSFTFYTIPISPLCNLKNFSFTCNTRSKRVNYALFYCLGGRLVSMQNFRLIVPLFTGFYMVVACIILFCQDYQ